MASLDYTAMSAALKEYYHGQKVTDLVYKKNPFFARVKKDTKAGGKVIPIPLQYGVSQGRSASFAKAQANQTAPKLAEFMLTRATDYSTASIDNQMIEATEGDAAAFISAVKVGMDSAYRTLVLSTASGLFRSGTGSIGKIASITTGVITLSEALQATQFEVGMTLVAQATSDGGTPRAALGYVIAVDRLNGTVTVSDSAQGGAAGSPTSWAANDFLAVEGDTNAKIKGLGAWLPVVRPTTGDNFFGVDRSVDPSRLAGVVFDGSAMPIDEAIIDLANLCAENGGSPGDFYTNYRTYGALVKTLGTKVQYVDFESSVGIGFRGVRINGDDGDINVIPDHSCPAKTGFMLDMDTWTLYSVGDVPHILTYGKEGLEMIRQSSADAAEVRLGAYCNLGCNAPAWNGQVILGA